MIPFILNDNSTELTPTTTALVIIIIKRFTKHLVLLKENINRHRSCYLGILKNLKSKAWFLFLPKVVEVRQPTSLLWCGNNAHNFL